MVDYSKFYKSLSNNMGQPNVSFKALYELVNNLVGIKLFTMTTFDIPNATAERIFSNMPNEYPISGIKPIIKSDWTEIVLDKGEDFVANNINDIAKVFSDYEIIDNLGCQSVINLPVIVDGNLLGTMNCLHEENYFTTRKINELANFKLPALACFLLNSLKNKTG